MAEECYLRTVRPFGPVASAFCYHCLPVKRRCTASRYPFSRTAVCLAASLLSRRIPFFQARENFRRRGIGRTGIERWRRIVFEPQLDRFRGLPVAQDRHQRQRKIDSGGDAAASNAVAVDTYPC